MIQTDIERLQSILTDALRAEWEAQGHSMTGKVINDIEYKVKQETDNLTIEGYMYAYANYQAQGAKWPNKRPPIAPLQEYVKNRMGITDEKKSKSIAFAIAATLKKEGLPTSGGMKYSSTGKRSDFIGEALKKSEEKLTDVISAMTLNQLNISMDTLIEKWNVLLNQR
jgi:hypothetical protein